MHKGVTLPFILVAAVAFGLTVIANEKPSVDFQNVMKSNGATNMALRATSPRRTTTPSRATSDGQGQLRQD